MSKPESIEEAKAGIILNVFSAPPSLDFPHSFTCKTMPDHDDHARHTRMAYFSAQTTQVNK